MRTLKTLGHLILLATAVLFAGCSMAGSGGSPSTKTSPTPLSGFSTFISSDGVYGLHYPSDWGKAAVTTSPVVNGETFYSADSTSYFVVLPLNTSLPADQYGAFAKGFASGLGGSGISIASSTSTATFGGKSWTIMRGATTLKGTRSELKLYCTDFGSNTLIIVTLTPQATTSTVTNTDFYPMLHSFTILKQE